MPIEADKGCKMDKVYFDVRNGEVVRPSEYLPGYSALVKDGQIKSIRACFAQTNIDHNGDGWALYQTLKSAHEWSNYSWLMPSLQKYVASCPWETKDFEQTLQPNFLYVTFLELAV